MFARISWATTLLGLCFFLIVVRASAEEYRIIDYPDLQNGLSLSGTINASDLDNDMILDAAELSSWSLTIDGNTSTNNDQDAGSLVSNVSIADGMIFLEDPRVSGVEEQFILAIALEAFINYFNGPHSSEYNEQVYNGRSGAVPSPEWLNQTLATNGPNLPMPASNGRIVIARLVPEPGTFALVMLALLGLACGSRRSSRRWSIGH